MAHDGEVSPSGSPVNGDIRMGAEPTAQHQANSGSTDQRGGASRRGRSGGGPSSRGPSGGGPAGGANPNGFNGAEAAEPDPDVAADDLGPRILVLLRHGKSGYPNNVVDHDRPLAPRGRREAALAGDWLRAGSWDPTGDATIDLVRCSTATRARETLERTGIEAPTKFTDEIYEATSDEIVAMLRRVHHRIRTLLVVGHGPGLPDTALALAGPHSDPDALDAIRGAFPTSALAVIDVPGTWEALDPATTSLRMFHVPRE